MVVKKLILAVAAVAGILVIWRYAPIDKDALLTAAVAVRESPLAPLVVPVVYVLLSLMFVPIVVLRLTTVLAFGPIFGPLYAITGMAAAAFVGHLVGERLGAEALERLGGTRVARIRERLAKTGIWGIAVLRTVPLGPFTLVNAVAGAARVRRRDFVLGTVVGTTPGLVVMMIFAQAVT